MYAHTCYPYTFLRSSFDGTRSISHLFVIGDDDEHKYISKIQNYVTYMINDQWYNNDIINRK